MAKHRVAIIAGDGIGPEVIAEGIKVLSAVQAKIKNLSFEYEHFPWGCDYYLANGEMMPQNGLEILKGFDAIYLGAIGDPRVPDHISVRDLVLQIRIGFDQYANVRPIKLLEGVSCPLKDKTPQDIDFVVIRENTEGFYAGCGGRYRKGTPEHGKYAGLRQVFADSEEVVVQEGVLSQIGVERVITYAFDLARSRKKHLTCCTKSNALNYSMVYWDEVFRKIASSYPDVRTDFAMVDATCMWMVKNPENFDVIVAENLFGDIITDLGAAIQGGMGVAAGANLNPHGLSMFEPIHGSAPKYTGKNVINPIATIWAGIMMLEQLGEKEAATLVEKSVKEVLREGKYRTKDLGGTSSTSEVGDAVADAIYKIKM